MPAVAQLVRFASRAVAASRPVAEQRALNLEPRVQVRPPNDVTIVQLENGEAFIRGARWWLIAWFQKGFVNC